MERFKSFLFTAGILLLILAASASYVAIKNLTEVVSANRYEDEGVLMFQPYRVLPVQVENTGAVGRQRRMNPTRTVYMVYYRDTEGNGYEWKQQALSREAGQAIVEAGVSAERRVLRIPDKGTYITVKPWEDAKSYTRGLQSKYVGFLVISSVYLVLYLLVWSIVRIRRFTRPE